MRLLTIALLLALTSMCFAQSAEAKRRGYYYGPRRAVVVTPRRAYVTPRPRVEFYYSPAPRYYSGYRGYGGYGSYPRSYAPRSYSYGYRGPVYGGRTYRDHDDWDEYYDDLEDRREDYEDWLEDQREDYEDRMEDLRERREEAWEDWRDRWD